MSINLESVLASMTLGYVIGFGYLTAWDAFKLTRQARNPARNLFSWMVWGLIVACLAMSVGAWLLLHGLIQASVASLFLTLLLWVFQVHFVLQIIISRIALISPIQETVKLVRIGVAVFITLINITVIATFIPAVLRVSPAITTGGEVWVKIAKILIMITDCFLNFYFISEVKDNLVRNGLQKYDKLCQFNMGIIVVSVLFDLFLFATTFLPGSVLFVAFLPVTYITKLKIELSMTKLIVKIARQGMQPRYKPSMESSTTAVSRSGPSFGHTCSSSMGGGIGAGNEGVSSFGLGLGIGGPSYEPSQPGSRFSNSTDEGREKTGPRKTEQEVFEGI